MISPDLARELEDTLERHALFAQTFLKVKPEAGTIDGQPIPMILGPGQTRLDESIRKQRAQGRPVRIIYLKSRRIQASTGTAAQFFHWTVLHPGTKTLVLGHQADSTETLFRMYRRFYENFDPHPRFGLAKPVLVDSRGQPLNVPLSDRLDFKDGSKIECHTAGNVAFGRSDQFTLVHFSEFPYYRDAAEIRTAVMSAVAKLPETCVVVEGTAKSVGDEFHRMWTDAMSGESEFAPLFMAWQEHPSNRMPLTHELTRERLLNSLNREDRETYERLCLQPEQMLWWLYTLKNDCGNDRTKMRREHPSSPEEAFTSSSRNRFSVPHIMRMPVQREAMVGELELRPVGDEERIVWVPNDAGCVKIYRRPERGRFYAAGSDCSQGLDANEGGDPDPDYWTAQILDRDTGEQCAVARARKMPGESGRYLTRILRYYNNAQLAGERNPGGGGIAMLEAVLDTGYPASLLYHDAVSHEDDPKLRGNRLGFSTSGSSRPLLVSYIDDWIREEAVYVHDPQTQSELLTFVYWPDGKPRAQKGAHDDLVIALGLAIVVILRMPRPRAPEEVPKLGVTRYGRGVTSMGPGPRGRGR
jgi:hypothetical protein